MKNIKIKLAVILMVFSLFIMLPFSETTYASSESDMFEEIYNQSKNMEVTVINDDYDSYSVLLNNLKNVIIDKNNYISGDIEKINESYNFDSTNLEKLNDFINRLNRLIELNAVTVNRKLEISVITDIPREESVSVMAPVMDILIEARAHAIELREVYDNAVFGTKHAVAGTYFTERVKSGGIWDYKVYLGTNTMYYDIGLNSYITGETIGNFHYGYVGSEIFSPFTLKSAAGLVQIISGTSDTSFWDSYFDDPRDTEDIQWGIDVYNTEH